MSDHSDLRDFVRIDIDLPERIETGAVQFGDDWTGLFIRGDDCYTLRSILRLFYRNVMDRDPAYKLQYWDFVINLIATIDCDVRVIGCQSEVEDERDADE